MDKGNTFKAIKCQKTKKINIIVKGSDKVLRSKSLDTFEDNNDTKEGDEMTTNELYSLIKWLKKEGYTLEAIIELLEYIADKK